MKFDKQKRLRILDTDITEEKAYRNILRFYDNTTRLTWYKEANEFAQHLSVTYGIDIEAACKVIAITSPLTPWYKNMENAEKACKIWANGEEQITVHMFKNQSDKAYATLNGKTVKLGVKEESFYYNIFMPDSTDHVTIDSVAIAIIVGLGDYKGVLWPSKKAYKKAATIYTKLAKHLSISPSALQAVVWENARIARQTSGKSVQVFYERMQSV